MKVWIDWDCTDGTPGSLEEFADRTAAMTWLNEHAPYVKVHKVIEGRELKAVPEQVVTQYLLEAT